jgi:hypothetical protein
MRQAGHRFSRAKTSWAAATRAWSHSQHSPGGPARRPGRQRLSMGWRQGLEGGRDTPQASPHSAPRLHRRRLQAWVPSLTPHRQALWGTAPGARAAMPRARAVVGAVGTGLRLSRLVRDGATAIALRGAGQPRPSYVVRDKAWSASMGAGRRGESCLGCRSVTSSALEPESRICLYLGLSTSMYSDRYQKDRRGQLDKDFGAQYINNEFQQG